MSFENNVDFYISGGKNRFLRTYLMRSKNVFDVWNDNMLSNLFFSSIHSSNVWTCGFTLESDHTYLTC